MGTGTGSTRANAVVRLAAVAAAAGLAAAAAGCTIGGRPPNETGGAAPAPQSLTALESQYEQVVRRVLPSVVQIISSDGTGSGVVFDRRGHIVTNAHVVGRDRSFRVVPATGGRQLQATLVSSFPAGDLAVIRVSGGTSPPAAVFGDSSRLRVGQIVLAMGNPLGLAGSVTNGIVSAVGRTVQEPAGEGSPGATITNAIQTSAAINPGNSGGALVDLTGSVVGVPTIAATDPQLGGGAAPGIGFAIPSNTVKDIARQIIAEGAVTNSRRAALGITGRSVIDAAARPAGVGVERLTSGGPAERAGIQIGDVITAVAGRPTPTLTALAEVLVLFRPGNQVRVALTRRDGGAQEVTVVLGELPGG
jgi:S1-C subfamily serine protease